MNDHRRKTTVKESKRTEKLTLTNYKKNIVSKEGKAGSQAHGIWNYGGSAH